MHAHVDIIYTNISHPRWSTHCFLLIKAWSCHNKRFGLGFWYQEYLTGDSAATFIEKCEKSWWKPWRKKTWWNSNERKFEMSYHLNIESQEMGWHPVGCLRLDVCFVFLCTSNWILYIIPCHSWNQAVVFTSPGFDRLFGPLGCPETNRKRLETNLFTSQAFRKGHHHGSQHLCKATVGLSWDGFSMKKKPVAMANTNKDGRWTNRRRFWGCGG